MKKKMLQNQFQILHREINNSAKFDECHVWSRSWYYQSILSSLIVELGFGQKFKPDPRIDVRSGWTDQSSQPDPRVDVRRVLPSLSELAIYRKVRKNSLSAQFSVERYIVLIHLTSKSSSPPSRPHHQAVPITKPSSPPSRPHHQAVPTTKSSPPPSRPHHQVVPTTKPSPSPSRSHHQAVLTTKPYYQATVASQPTKPPYQATLPSHTIKRP
jgi:hypothetical protein